MISKNYYSQPSLDYLRISIRKKKKIQIELKQQTLNVLMSIL